MEERVNLGRVAVVLHRPRFPENIGAAARAIQNMGISRLIVVRPEDLDMDRVHKMATRAALEVVENIRVEESLAKALAPFGYVVGTTARTGSHRKSVHNPAQVAEHLVPVTRENDAAIVFGPEDKGLANDELRFCHALVTIPTAGFASLNLAQAVMVMAYETHKASRPLAAGHLPRLATRRELDDMYVQFQEILARIGFINPQNPEHWMDNLRWFLNRHPLTAREVKIIRGICRQIDWYTERRLGGKGGEDGGKPTE
jgi:tRNA/rRNA methyltransferase